MGDYTSNSDLSRCETVASGSTDADGTEDWDQQLMTGSSRMNSGTDGEANTEFKDYRTKKYVRTQRTRDK
jgi:hypothetical protein